MEIVFSQVEYMSILFYLKVALILLTYIVPNFDGMSYCMWINDGISTRAHQLFNLSTFPYYQSPKKNNENDIEEEHIYNYILAGCLRLILCIYYISLRNSCFFR